MTGRYALGGALRPAFWFIESESCAPKPIFLALSQKNVETVSTLVETVSARCSPIQQLESPRGSIFDDHRDRNNRGPAVAEADLDLIFSPAMGFICVRIVDGAVAGAAEIRVVIFGPHPPLRVQGIFEAAAECPAKRAVRKIVAIAKDGIIVTHPDVSAVAYYIGESAVESISKTRDIRALDGRGGCHIILRIIHLLGGLVESRAVDLPLEANDESIYLPIISGMGAPDARRVTVELDRMVGGKALALRGAGHKYIAGGFSPCVTDLAANIGPAQMTGGGGGATTGRSAASADLDV